MKKKGYVFTALLAGAVLLGLNSAPTEAARVSMPAQGTSYVKKGNTYRLYFKAPVRLTVTTTAKYTITNTSGWKCIPYANSKKNTKTFYLRAGHFDLTTTSKKNAKIKTSYKKITSLRKSLETFSYKKYPSNIVKPTEIKLNQQVNGLADMYRTEKYNAGYYYQFTLDKDQKVTLDLSTMPVYQNAKSNIFNNNTVRIDPVSYYGYKPDELKYTGKGTHKKYSWNLTKGTYVIEVMTARGRYNFKLTSEDTTAIPAASKITKITPTKDNSINVEYTKADGATGYGVYVVSNDRLNYWDNYILNSWTPLTEEFPNTLSQSTEKHSDLTNGQTYRVAVRSMNNTDGKTFGPVSDVVDYTYYIPLDKDDQIVPQTPKTMVSYYDDHGSDEPYIDVDWNIDENADSHEIEYRLKGAKNWSTMFSSLKNGDEITSPENKQGSLFKKGQVFEVRVRALHGNRKSAWSDVKTITVNVDQA